MSRESYDAFVRSFPSAELLCQLFGVTSYDALFEKHYREVVRHIRRGEILRVYPSDVSLSRARESGELTSQKGKGDKEIFVLNKELYRKSHDLFEMVRKDFHAAFIVSAMQYIRRQDGRADKGNMLRPVYIFKDGGYGECVLARIGNSLPADKVFRRKLCNELIVALEKNPMYTDIWWEYKIDNDSVWLQPKELTRELKTAMQKLYEEKRAESRFVTENFYPGWEPDKSRDPPDDWQPSDQD